jgi:hypothetical protein
MKFSKNMGGNIIVRQIVTLPNPFFWLALLAKGILKKDSTIWLDGAGLMRQFYCFWPCLKMV